MCITDLGLNTLQSLRLKLAKTINFQTFLMSRNVSD